MVNDTIRNYVDSQLEKGATKESIKEELQKSGWQEQDIEEALSTSTVMNTKLIDPGILIDQSVKIFIKRLNPLALIALTPLLVGIVVGLLFFALGAFSVALLSVFEEITPMAFVAVGLVFLPIFLTFYFMTLWSTIAVVEAIADTSLGFIEAFKKTFHKVPKVFVTLLVFSLVVLGGYYLFIVPGVIVAFLGIFVPMVLILEDITGFQALYKSKKYFEGYALGIIGRMLLIGILVGIAMMFIQVPINVLFGFFAGLLNTEAINGFGGVITQFISYALSPFSTIALYLLYKNVKEIKQLPEGPAEVSKEFSIISKIFLVVGIIGSILLIFLGIYLATQFSDWYQKERPLDNPESFIENLESETNYNYEYNYESEINTEFNSERTLNQALNDLPPQYNIGLIIAGLNIYRSSNGTYPTNINEILNSSEYLTLTLSENFDTASVSYRLTQDGESFVLCIPGENAGSQECYGPAGAIIEE